MANFSRLRNDSKRWSVRNVRVAVWHNLPSGGGKRALYNHVLGLVERGHHVESWCPSTASQEYLPLSKLITEHILPIEIPSNVREKSFRAFWHSPALRDTLGRRMLAHSKVCADQMASRNFDIVFANSCVFFRVPAISRFTLLPKVLYLQEPNRWLYESLPELPWIAPDVSSYKAYFFLHPLSAISDQARLFGLRTRARQELKSVRQFDKVLVNSLFSRESLLRSYGIDASVCYLGVDPGVFESTGEQRRNMVVGVGSFDQIKNIDFVIKAISCLSDLSPELVWIGNSGDRHYMETLEKLAISLKVNYTAMLNLSDSELVSLLSQARVMAYAPRLEPFGLTPLEANLCELPVVAVAEGGVRETVVNEENGVLCDSTPEAMALEIRRFLEDPDRAERLGKRARQHALEKWNPTDANERLESALLAVAGGRE